MPGFSPLFIWLIAIGLLALLQIEFIEAAFAKLGLSPHTSLAILFGSLLGSGINVPIFSIQATTRIIQPPSGRQPLVWPALFPQAKHRTIIALNLGGCIIPVGLCIYFISLQLVNISHILLGILTISVLSHSLSKPIQGIGIGMPIFIAPLAAAGLSLILEPAHAAHLAYISGVLGVLIGADVFNLQQISKLGTPMASIGGAGSFDGIFLTGVIAAWLA